jgi:hypothetical protein
MCGKGLNFGGLAFDRDEQADSGDADGAMGESIFSQSYFTISRAKYLNISFQLFSITRLPGLRKYPLNHHDLRRCMAPHEAWLIDVNNVRGA